MTAYPTEHVPTRRLTLEQLRAMLIPALESEDAILAELRKRFLSTSAFLEAPNVQFHRGQREAIVMVLRHIDGLTSRDVLVLTSAALSSQRGEQ